ncbi:tRNA guanosine(34) transglycosylase Tgt [Desulfogranum japonicum]|uniref:tRNA guanosine(34) transglycosylase Tgt n=1 Tax=Desulfogranum japonicum TaxID=231447 RepID=UPI0003FF9246|nr:tRNA guanosine(34) transglycosylase Tgt [Desulfogranum japonicum]
MGRLHFKIDGTCKDSAARACTYETLHNTVKTPVFMPVATRAALRAQRTEDAEALGFPVLLANTYHLLIRPGIEVFNHFKGIHNFMQWPGSVLTDSGGFQVFSLSRDVTIRDEGATFKSYLDNNFIHLTPEKSIEVQKAIGSDIMMVLDQCVNATSSYEETLAATELTSRWAERSLAARQESPQFLFGIVQGGRYEKLRKMSAGQITSLPFDGFAIGGLAVGEEDHERKDLTELTASLLPSDRPRYLMGVGTPIDLLEAVHRGVDMFDCILPTAMGRQGVAWTSHGRIDLRRSVHKFSERPLDNECECETCRKYSRAYLHHLVKCDEYLASQLVGLHNLTFYKRLMDQMRQEILNGTFYEYYRRTKETLTIQDRDNPVTAPKKKKRKDHSKLGKFRVVTSSNGWHTILDEQTGEKFHSINDPYSEADTLYVSPTLARLEKDRTTIWDVGLGAGFNAMRFILAYEEMKNAGSTLPEIQLLSFEKDLDSLKLAKRNYALFTHVRHQAVASILARGEWTSKDEKFSWHLVPGDFQKTKENAQAPDIIWYDMFSQKSDSHLWTYHAFREIADKCNSAGKDHTALFTYSNSTAIRAALLAAGFYVALGPCSGPKPDTTKAYIGIKTNESVELLDRRWLKKFTISSAPVGPNTTEEDKSTIEDKVLSHPQFEE